ncbi:DUF262 domain-containing protein, partial [Oleiphilus sp. HI0061]|uniref:DUF262 domain-containing protein n=1 Tax=Oleiphilus sp. HI0061 TaxID=1822239 RepID=UPI0012E83868
MDRVKTDKPLVQIENLLERYQPEFSELGNTPVADLFNQLQEIISSSNTLILKKIDDLLSLSFFVDDYQRGYKWLPLQVEALLNDIHDFDPQADSFYCLQPVVVKHHSPENTGERGRWELIDGQQRITTTFMILSYLGWKKYPIDYKTRASSGAFLQHYLERINPEEDWDSFLSRHNDSGELTAADLDNVDNYHFYIAYCTIARWFSDTQRFPDGQARKRWHDKLLYHTQVIWYAAKENESLLDKEQSINIFMCINSGKIPLTNA